MWNLLFVTSLEDAFTLVGGGGGGWCCVGMCFNDLIQFYFIFCLNLPDIYIYIYIRLTLYLRDGNCFEGGTKSYIYIYIYIYIYVCICQKSLGLHICISMWLIMSMMDLFKLWWLPIILFSFWHFISIHRTNSLEQFYFLIHPWKPFWYYYH